MFKFLFLAFLGQSASVVCRPKTFFFKRHLLLCVVVLEQDTFGPWRKKTCLRGFANDTGGDQPAHPRSLISASVISFLESIICKLATGKVSIF